MRKLILIAVVLLSLVITTSVALGSAADLRVQGGTIQAGQDTDVKMYKIAEVLGWGLETDDGLVYSVRMHFTFDDLTGPPGGDNELSYFVNITGVNGEILTQGSVSHTFPIQPTSDYNITLTIPFDDAVPACDIYDIHVFVEGAANSGPTAAECPEFVGPN